MVTHVKHFFVFQWNSTMSSTTCNDVINVKHNWGCCVLILIIYSLVSKIYTRKVHTTPQYTFPVRHCIIRMRIYAHCSLFFIRCSGINMKLMWHHRIIYVSYKWFSFSWDLLFWSFCLLSLIYSKYLSLQENNDKCILSAKVQHSQPHMTLYHADIFFNWVGNSECNVEPLIIIL